MRAESSSRPSFLSAPSARRHLATSSEAEGSAFPAWLTTVEAGRGGATIGREVLQGQVGLLCPVHTCSTAMN
eukprot:4024081-Pyramimonas_sp.AAC.1